MKIRVTQATKTAWYYHLLEQDIECSYVTGKGAVFYDNTTIPATDFEVVRDSRDVLMFDRDRRLEAAKLAATLENKNVAELLDNADTVYKWLMNRVEKVNN